MLQKAFFLHYGHVALPGSSESATLASTPNPNALTSSFNLTTYTEYLLAILFAIPSEKDSEGGAEPELRA